MTRPPLPPFDAETAAQKARFAENAWNTRDPVRVAEAYTLDSVWRVRHEFVNGRDAIRDLLARKWAQERDYRLIKEVWAFTGARIAVRMVPRSAGGGARPLPSLPPSRSSRGASPCHSPCPSRVTSRSRTA